MAASFQRLSFAGIRGFVQSPPTQNQGASVTNEAWKTPLYVLRGKCLRGHVTSVLLLGHQLFGIASHHGVNLSVENTTSVDRERATLPSVLVLPHPRAQPPLRQALSLNTEALSECRLPQWCI